jgi:hypothetical protein
MFDKITRRADCANKRRIYKLGVVYLRKNKIEYRMFDKITRRADCANKRRIYKYSGIICGSVMV